MAKPLTPSEIARMIQSHRRYTVTCECGKCKKCKAREYRRKRRKSGLD